MFHINFFLLLSSGLLLFLWLLYVVSIVQSQVVTNLFVALIMCILYFYVFCVFRFIFVFIWPKGLISLARNGLITMRLKSPGGDGYEVLMYDYDRVNNLGLTLCLQ